MIALWRKYFVKSVFQKVEWQSETQKQNLRTALRKGSWERTGGAVKWDRLKQLQYVGHVGLGQGRGVSIMGGIGWD